MSLTIGCLVLAAVFLWAGFRAPRRTFQHRSQFGFFACLAIAMFTGYFAWREARTVAELTELIDPVPEITDVTYIPTAAEAGAIAEVLAAVPRGKFGSTREERSNLAEQVRKRATDYWLVKTALSQDSVLAFYREAAPRRGWTIETDHPPWLFLSRGRDRLTLFLSSSRRGTQILFSFAKLAD